MIRTVWATKLGGMGRVWSRQGDVTDKKNENEKSDYWGCGERRIIQEEDFLSVKIWEKITKGDF